LKYLENDSLDSNSNYKVSHSLGCCHSTSKYIL